MILGTGWVLLRQLRREKDMMAAMLLACWVMINTHSLMEINFSIRAYQCIVYPLFMLIAMCYAKPVRAAAVKAAGWIISGCIWVYMGLFGGAMQIHMHILKEMETGSAPSIESFIKTVDSWCKWDIYDDEYLKLMYVTYAQKSEDEQYCEKIDRYEQDILTSGTYTGCNGLVQNYYILTGEMDKLFAASR